jgi:ribonuclease E
MNKEAGENTETPKKETPKKEAPKPEAPEAEAPKTDAPKEEPSTGESKQGFEDKLDGFADRFSKAMTVGVKRME